MSRRYTIFLKIYFVVADLLAPPYLYSMLRGGRLHLGSRSALTAVPPLAITRGRFDPFDLLAYTLGLLVSYAVDVRWLRPRGILPGPRAA